MARIIGVEVPPNKRIDIALRYIYGIGPVNAKEVLERANIAPSIRAKDLTETQLSQIVHAILEGKYVIEGDLRRELGMNLKYVERDFRITKIDDLDLRPIYHYLQDRVRGHVLICMLACYLTASHHN